ncbi:MAG: hypothetical protein K9L89_07480, partial [Kiritimatiellales bacterium]|nr:hypothetical protein [Kiritimatiellales bacterium]
PPATHKSNATPPTEPRQTTRPPGERKPNMTPPTEHRNPAPHPDGERKPNVAPPTEHRQKAPPPAGRSENRGAETDARQRPTFNPPRETRQPRSERVEIPASPVAGQSGRQGFFQKGPPSQPSDEARGKKDSHRK